MSWLSFLWSKITGGGGIVSAVDDAIQLGGQVLAEVHDHNQNVAGQDKIIATDNAASAKAQKNASQAMVNTTHDSALKQLSDGSA